MSMWDSVRAAAAILGMERRGPHHADGVVDGRPVSLSLDLLDHQSALTVEARLAPPLDLGLEMHRSAVARVGYNAVVTGSDDLDSEFVIHADDPERTRALFDDALRGHLAALYRTPYDFRLHDGGVALVAPYGFGADEHWIVRAAHVAAGTLAMIDAARERLLSAAPLRAHAHALGALAAARGLAFSTAPLSVSGRLDGRPVALDSERTGHGHHRLRARAPFEAELGLGLSVRRERVLDRLRTALGGQDVPTGDQAFDHRFLVQVDPAHAARVPALLDHDVRAALLALDQRAGQVTVDDAGASVGPIDPAVPPETVAWALDALDEARARVERNLLHGGEGGPYR